ncbi:hypothetical protein [Kitasatospora griseola]|uniref:hypothetical protein n=1 Tax=Kitasatospora griseola TaxID=2064 RepID=UPI0016717197|nr:hypothetical protein [Kitasatospora griseola]GGQ94893.1 hypothetical protein GCM10010195_58390 [Kitasatospora griseola]
MKDFRLDLSDELSALTPPPLGDIVAEATRKGRRARRVRTIGQVSGSALALAAAVVLAAGHLPGTANDTASGTVGPAAGGTPALAAPAGPTPSPTASGALVRVSGAAVLATVLDALPAGLQTSGYAANGATDAHGKYAADVPVAQVNIQTPQGLGMMRVFVGTASPDAKCSTDDGCHRDRYGQQVRTTHVNDNCIQNTVITVRHADSTAVTVQMATCLAWNGTANLPGVLPLTEEAAAELAANPAFHTMMTPAQGAAAAARFPALPPIN